jgi:hypothetical protein
MQRSSVTNPTTTMDAAHEPETLYTSPQRWDTLHNAQLVDSYGTASQRTSHTSPDLATGQASCQTLGFLPLAEWDEYNSYDEETPSLLRYSIEWKVVVNNRVVAKDTEQDLVLVPSAHWHLCLKPKVEKVQGKKVAYNRHVEFDDTSVVVSVNDRSQRDLTKRFDSMDIDWSVIERQLTR